MTDNIKMAGELLTAAKQILVADYVYDPGHRSKPRGGSWHKTDKGWSDIKEQENLANSSSTSPEMLDRLSRGGTFTRINVALNRNTSGSTLRSMAKRETNTDVMYQLLKRKEVSADSESLGRMADNCARSLMKHWTFFDFDVTSDIAKNPNTPPECLDTLAKGCMHSEICSNAIRTISERPDTPVSVFTDGAFSPDSLKGRIDELFSSYDLDNPEYDGDEEERLNARDTAECLTEILAENLLTSVNDHRTYIEDMLGGDENGYPPVETAEHLSSMTLPTHISLIEFKRSYGGLGKANSSRVKEDFLSSMKQGQYELDESFDERKSRIKYMPADDFIKILSNIDENEDIDY